MTIKPTFVVRDLASLSRWRQQLLRLTSSQNLPVVQFQLREFSSEQNQSFSALAGSFQNACGCGSGSFLMSVTVVAIVVSYFVSGNRISNINLSQVLSFVGVTVFAALAGKLLGLLWARWRLLRLATGVHNRIVRSTRQAVTESI